MGPEPPTTASQLEAIYRAEFEKQLATREATWKAQLGALQTENERLRTSGAPQP